MSRRSTFDTNRDGELDSIEMAAAAAFLEEIENEANNEQIRTHQRKRTRKHSVPTGIAFLGAPIYDANKDTGCLRILVALILLVSPIPLMLLLDVEAQSWGVLLCMLVPTVIAILILKNC